MNPVFTTHEREMPRCKAVSWRVRRWASSSSSHPPCRTAPPRWLGPPTARCAGCCCKVLSRQRLKLGLSFNSRVGNSHQQEGSVAARQKHRQADCIKKQLQLNARRAALQRGAESKASRGWKKTKSTSQRDRMKVFGSPYFPRICPRLS